MRGSFLGLGCLPYSARPPLAHPCLDDPARTYITIDGSITATDAGTVELNGIKVDGNVTLIGGGDQDGAPWPIKLDTIGGNFSVSGATPEWLGVLLDNIGGNVTLTNVSIAPGETIDVGLNTIGRNLSCFGLAPAVAPGAPPARATTSAAMRTVSAQRQGSTPFPDLTWLGPPVRHPLELRGGGRAIGDCLLVPG